MDALDQLGKATAAVVTSGVNRYPASTQGLIADILADGGRIETTIAMPDFSIRSVLIGRDGQRTTLFEIGAFSTERQVN